ncbi:clostripain-related cysteine peptidase [Methanorbis rubei]|uniref:Peptidase C11 n=1 Tax=Methanorbis rubei TaxID=3028300 RepID=A0AAE4MGG0_9EURY|nr:hypothetical protein [Methanocorpusculaceae archaeon Cs1]
MSSQNFSKLHLLCGLLLILCSAAVPAAAAADENYLVMYVVGSDLESEGDQATDNLIDLVNSWDPSMGDVLIIYGGAKKAGWDDGVTITNLDLLTKDLEDGVIGVDTDNDGNPTVHVLDRFPDVDISDASTLANSLSYAEEYRKNSGLSGARNYLLFWNHGGGYTGFGQNEISKEILSLGELQTGLSGAGTRYDLIAFDACLMGSLEVADALSPYGFYLLASEENVPGCGYDYRAFSALSSTPNMSPEKLGTTIIEYYMAQPDQSKTLSLVRMSEAPKVVAALNAFGEDLQEILSDEESLNVLGSIYINTQGYGADSGSTNTMSMDLYDFTYKIYEQTSEDSELHASAENLLNVLNDFVVVCSDDGHFTAANGVSVAAPTSDLTEGIPNAAAFGRSGWYNYLSTYLNQAGASAQPHAAYEDNIGTRSTIVVNDTTGTAKVLANYLYVNEAGQYVIIGEVPLKEKTRPVNNSVWTTVPTGLYEEPDWDGSWYVFQNADGTLVPATLTFKNPAVIDNRPHVIYTIEGNLTRVVNTTSVTRPSIITVVIDDDANSVSDIYVTEKSDDIWGSRSNAWGNTTILSGDVFVPNLEIYDPESDEISVIASSQKIIFGDNPQKNLIYTELNPDNCYWMVELDDFIDDDAFYLEGPGMASSSPTQTQTPLCIAGVFTGLLLAGIICRRT